MATLVHSKKPTRSKRGVRLSPGANPYPMRPSFPAAAVIALIRMYRMLISPLLGSRCRYAPSCSEYATEAVQQYGALKGSWIAMKRLSRCHPWGGGGYDPVEGGQCRHGHQADRLTHCQRAPAPGSAKTS